MEIMNTNLYKIDVQNVGTTPDNRAIFKVTDQNKKTETYSTVPLEQKDNFEKEIQKVNKFANKLGNDPQKRMLQVFQLTSVLSVGLGATITGTLMKTPSKAKKFFGIMVGGLGGLLVGCTAILTAFVAKIGSMAKGLKSLDVQPYTPPEKFDNSNSIDKKENKTNNKVVDNKPAI